MLVEKSIIKWQSTRKRKILIYKKFYRNVWYGIGKSPAAIDDTYLSLY
jgi:hypothetical protein